MRLNTNETKVLRTLVEVWREDAGFCAFAYLGEETKLERKDVRRACRSLRRKGLTEFGAGLWSEDGEMRGAGYAATRAGREWVDDHAEPPDPMRGVEFPFAENH
jgi:hypothetical protein